MDQSQSERREKSCGEPSAAARFATALRPNATSSLRLLAFCILMGAASACTSVAPAAGADSPAGKLQPPNVVLILLDDLGWADLGCYGCKDIPTPHIDRLARRGVRLTQFYSNGPVCTPTRAALMTGRWQQRVGLEWAIPPGMKEPGLPAREVALARLLKNAGYRTALCGKWHLGYRPEFGPNAHGFDEFYGLLSGNVDHYSHKEINGELDWYENERPVQTEGYSTDLITRRAVAFIEQPSTKAMFLYLAYNAVHWPFQPPARPEDVRTPETWYRGTRADYGRMLRRVDDGIGQIMAALEHRGLTGQTLVILTNDNGGERLSDNGLFLHYKGTLWEGGIRVPCLISWPGRLAAGKVSTQPAITMDLTETIMAAAQATWPKGRGSDGMNLLPLLKGERPAVERTFFWRVDRPPHQQQAVRHGDWKYLRDRRAEMLFDLSRDPSEGRNLALRHPDKLGKLKRLYADWEADMARARPEFIVK